MSVFLFKKGFEMITTAEQRSSAPYRIFSDQVISSTVHQEIGNLNTKMEDSIDNLLKSQINPSICGAHLGEQNEEQIMCSNIVITISKLVQSTLNVVEESFWNLNSICTTNINPTIFHAIREMTEGSATSYKIEYKKPTRIRVKIVKTIVYLGHSLLA